MSTTRGQHQPPSLEDPANRVSPAPEGSMGATTGAGSMPVPQFDDLVVAMEHAQVFEALFQMPARPQTLGRYVVLSPLGQGGMGTVFEAFDRTLDRRVAVKVLHQELDEEHTTRLLREAQALAKLSHPNVVQVHEADTVGGQTFVVMELVKGKTLDAWIKQPPRPDWRQCVEVFIQVGQGLAAAHAQGLVHRDFKPSNAIVDDQGRARVLDFGLARRIAIDPTYEGANGHAQGRTADDLPRGTSPPELTASWPPPSRDGEPPLDTPLTEAGTILGTPAYISPEQVSEQRADERSDQFSFCVSLYEAVYGQRPFEGNTLKELIAAIKRDSVRPAPKGSAVPARLRRLLLQGLAVDPEKRWPSMDALLSELRTLVTPPPRRWIALGVTVGLVGLGSAVAVPQVLEIQQRCTGARAQLDGIWDDDRRQQVRGAILGTERSFAPGTWERIEPQLDAYAQGWIDTHTEICEATSVRGEQSDEALDLRMRCLVERRTALHGTIEVLADADTEVMRNAVKLAASLPALTRCNDLAWLEKRRQLVPPPEDPDVAAAVQAQRTRLAEIKAMQGAGLYVDALDAVEPVLEQAEALGYPPLRAEVLHRRGSIRSNNGQYAEAEEDLRQAHTLATVHYHDPVALDTAQRLTLVVGANLARHAEGQQWSEMVARPLAQRSGDPLQEARRLDHLGTIFRDQGDFDNALVHQQRALAIRQQARDPDHPDIATNLNRLGTIFIEQGDLENARVHYERSMAIWGKALGPEHPLVAKNLNNLGTVLVRQGDFERARDHHERALALWKKALDPDHPDIAVSLANLGTVFLGQGDLDKARVHLEQALQIFNKALGPNHPVVAKTLNNLGIIAFEQGDLEDARVHYQGALSIRQKALNPEHPDVASSYNNLGTVFNEQGDLQNARAHHERALTIREKALGPEHPDVAQSLDNLAALFDKQGDFENARAHQERALAIREKTQDPEHPDMATSHNNLGNVLLNQGDLDKARVHYERALAIVDEALGPEHPKGATSLLGLAKVAIETGDLASARAHAERAVSIREAAAVAPRLLAEARFVLARSLWSTPSMRARARALATQAQGALAAAGGPDQSDIDLADVEAWLATHRAK
ncbi:MAG: tetratricopeptide repeat protein [Myxococcota bacterium]